MASKSFTIDNILRGTSPARGDTAFQQLAPLHDVPSAYWMADPSSVLRPLWPIQNHPTAAIWFQQHHSTPVDLSASSVQRHPTTTLAHHPAALFSSWMPASMATEMTTGCWTTNDNELLAFTHHGLATMAGNSVAASPFFLAQHQLPDSAIRLAAARRTLPVLQPTRKGGQIRFTHRQSHHLEETFNSNRYLTPGQRRALANRLSLTERQVKTWFQNRRAKWRRSRKGEKLMNNGGQQHKPDETIVDHYDYNDDETSDEDEANEAENKVQQ